MLVKMRIRKVLSMILVLVFVIIVLLIVWIISNRVVTLHNLTGAELESVRIYELDPNQNGYNPLYRETTIRNGAWFEAYRDFFYQSPISFYEVEQPDAQYGLPEAEDGELPPRIYFQFAPNANGITSAWIELCGDGTAYFFTEAERSSPYFLRGKWYKVRLPNLYLFDARMIKEFVDESGLAVTPY